jgi:hypothetical protein
LQVLVMLYQYLLLKNNPKHPNYEKKKSIHLFDYCNHQYNTLHLSGTNR